MGNWCRNSIKRSGDSFIRKHKIPPLCIDTGPEAKGYRRQRVVSPPPVSFLRSVRRLPGKEGVGLGGGGGEGLLGRLPGGAGVGPVSYTHLRAHETSV